MGRFAQPGVRPHGQETRLAARQGLYQHDLQQDAGQCDSGRHRAGRGCARRGASSPRPAQVRLNRADMRSRSARSEGNFRLDFINFRLDFISVSFTLVVLVFIVVMIIPVAWAIFLGFTHSGPFQAGTTYAGLDNYRAVLADPAFWRAL